MEDQENKPKWLVELENKKRKPKLAHEVGAGAPCLNCESACPGLDLHFWRKICKNCKCRGDSHDVDDEDFPQFELLFGPGLKKKGKRAVVLKVNDKKQDHQETPFEWVPPDITKELAEDYMKALPSNKLPIKGSAGAALRRQQLQKQIPLHDIDHKACDNLSEQERHEFEKYLDNLKKSAGQGKVTKLTTIKPFDKSLMTPANATDVQQFSPQHSQSLMNPNSKLNLRTPSSFIPKGFQAPSKSNLPNSFENLNPTPSKMDVMKLQTLQARNEYSSQQPQYDHTLGGFSKSSQLAQSGTVPRGNDAQLKSNPMYHGVEHTKHPSNIASQEYPHTMQAHQSVPIKSNPMHHGVEHTRDSSTITDQEYPQSTQAQQSESMKNNAPMHHGVEHIRHSSTIAGQDYPQTTQAQRSEALKSNPMHHGVEHVRHSSSIAGQEYPETIQAQQSEAMKSNPMHHGVEHIRHSNTIAGEEYPQTIQAQQSESMKSNPMHHGVEHIRHSSTIAVQDYPQITQAQQSVPIDHKNSNIGTNDRLEQSFEFSKDRPVNAGVSQQTVSSEDLLLPNSRRAHSIGNRNLNETRPGHIHNQGGNDYSPDNHYTPGAMSAEYESMKHHPSVLNSEDISNQPQISEKLGNQRKSPNQEYKVPSNLSSTSPAMHLNAELNTSLPIQSNVIHSELLNNPIFPENSVNASIVHQDLDNISQLQNEMEAITMNASKLHQCHNCQEDIFCGEVVVTAEKIKEAVWHPGCFVCCACNELLVDLVYFSHKDKLYCARDFAEFLNIPRCFACDELIFVREYTVAEGHNYHVKHFCCWDCDIPLAERQYLTEEDRPVCLSCYQSNYAQTCKACNKVIAADQQGVTVKNLHFHVTEDCFCCVTCKKSLLGGKISVKENKLLCSKECIAEFLHRKAAGR